MSTTNGIHKAKYLVPEQTKRVFEDGILNNPLISKDLPKDAKEHGSRIHFRGTASPTIPINWRFAESVAALKGLEAVMVMALVKRKYGVDVQEVTINTDHASLFFMSTLLWALDPTGDNIESTAVAAGDGSKGAKLLKYFPSFDIHRGWSTPHRASTTNIYKTKDNRFFHLHGQSKPHVSRPLVY